MSLESNFWYFVNQKIRPFFDLDLTDKKINDVSISTAQWGVLGALTTHPLGGDGTAGRIPRGILLRLDNGTNPATLKCRVENKWNGDVIQDTDNIAKGGTTGDFSLSASGKELKVKASGLSGNCVHAFGSISYCATPNAKADCFGIGNDIYFSLTCLAVYQDLTVLVDYYPVEAHILYVTDD